MKKWLLGVLIIIVVIPMASMLYTNNKVPKLGVESGQLKAMPTSPNAVSSQTDDVECYVEPFVLKENSYEIILKIVKEMDKTKIITKSPTYIHVVFSTKMGFKDDVEFYFDEVNELIHFRSASRLGYSDMGKNKERYNDIKLLYLKNISD